jgi:bacteriocin resistance YdeI/OmpD-like protein
MPGNVRGALAKRELMDAFRARPDYQQNEYLKWIATAAGVTTKQQRLDQMLDELKHGALFKGEPWTPPAPAPPATARPKS